VARSASFTVGSSFVVPVVQDRDRWQVTVTALEEDRIKVKAGTFDCVIVALDPKNVGDDKKKTRFTGLFGINGTIKIWIDKRTRLPVRILGSIPFAFMDLNCEVRLRKISARPLAQTRAKPSGA
jgi:hypothetical protein